MRSQKVFTYTLSDHVHSEILNFTQIMQFRKKNTFSLYCTLNGIVIHLVSFQALRYPMSNNGRVREINFKISNYFFVQAATILLLVTILHNMLRYGY